MIDIQILRDSPDLVKRKSAEKKMDIDADSILKLDEDYRSILGEVENLRQKRNDISSKMKGGNPDQALVNRGKQLIDF